MTEFQSALIGWFEANKRDLPWRATRDPYAVWVSEMMLQQTTVAAVVPYYNRWMERFPTVAALAEADEDEVHQYWQGLGYYRRARALHSGARVVSTRMPTNRDDWLAVPGVGPYTAAAVASIALGEAVPLVDGNVERVYARLADSESPKPALAREAWVWAERHLLRERPGDWNQALMELGATVCRKQNPNCSVCPVHAWCRAWRLGTVSRRPVSSAKPPKVDVRQAVLVARVEGRFAVRRVPAGDWWQGLWEFPRVPPPAETPEKWRWMGEVKTVVTKHRVTLEVYRVDDLESADWKTPEEIDALALSSPMRKVWAAVRTVS